MECPSREIDSSRSAAKNTKTLDLFWNGNFFSAMTKVFYDLFELTLYYSLKKEKIHYMRNLQKRQASVRGSRGGFPLTFLILSQDFLLPIPNQPGADRCTGLITFLPELPSTRSLSTHHHKL